MKRAVSMILALVMCLSLCGCKSKDVKNVEAEINALNADSTYAQIYSVYSLYRSLQVKDQVKVENLDVLGKYCDPNGGELVLTAEMLAEIEAEFEVGALGVTGAEFSVIYGLASWSVIYGWSDHGDIKITSHKKSDRYTYSVYGTFKVADAYGSVSTQKFELRYYAEYNAEEPAGYKISHEVNVQK